MMRDLGDLRPGARGRGGASDKRVLISIAPGDSPSPRDAPAQPEFEPVGALTAGLNDSGGVVRVSRACVRTVQPKNPARQRKKAIHIPFDASLIVIELFGFDLLRNGRQGGELIPGARQIGDAV